MKFLLVLLSFLAFAQQVDWITQIRNKPAVDSRGYKWAPQTPGGTITASVSKTITLTPCPPGFKSGSFWSKIWISDGTGTAEAVIPTGGTCTNNARTGTVIFTSAYNHSGAWTVQSATDGIEDAINANSRQVAVVLPSGTLNVKSTLVVPTPVSIKGQGAFNGTTVYCALTANPCIARASAGPTNSQGAGSLEDFYLLGPDSGTTTGIWIGGDPSSIFAPEAWEGSHTWIHRVNVYGFHHSVTHYRGNFVTFQAANIAATDLDATGRAMYFLAGSGGECQPLEFYDTLLGVYVADVAVQQDNTDAYGSCPVNYFGGQISGAITGTAVDMQLFGTHLEGNRQSDISGYGVLKVTSGGAKVGIHGGFISIHISSGGNPWAGYAIDMAGANNHLVIDGDSRFQVDSGRTMSGMVKFDGASNSGSFSMRRFQYIPAGTFTDIYSIVGGTNLSLDFEFPCNWFYGCSNVASTTTDFRSLPVASPTSFPLNYPVSQTLVLSGATVAGGIKKVTGLFPGQSGTFVTREIQDFVIDSGYSGHNVETALTTVPYTPYTYVYIDNKVWIK